MRETYYLYLFYKVPENVKLLSIVLLKLCACLCIPYLSIETQCIYV